MAHNHHNDHACHGHDHIHPGKDTQRYLLLALLTMGGVAAQAYGTYRSQSFSLGTDTIHIAADCLLYSLAWGESYLAKRGSRFVSRKERLGRLAGWVLLISGFLSILIGGHLLLSSGNRPDSAAMLVPTLLGLAVNIAMARVLSRMHGGLALQAAIWHNVWDIVSSLIVVSVMVSGMLYPHWGHLTMVDPAASILVGGILMWLGGKSIFGEAHVH